MPILHHVFGLRLACNRPIPGLERGRGDAPADVAVVLEPSARWWADVPVTRREALYTHPLREANGTPLLRVWRLPRTGHRLLCYADGTEFAVGAAGREIWSAWAPPLTLADAAAYLLGPVLGLAQMLRGRTLLHGGVACVDGRAVAFLGPSGAGKSTALAALVERGARLVCDDAMAVEARDGRFWVAPGPPSLRLWPDSVAALYGRNRRLPRLSPGWDKRALALPKRDGRRCEASVPLAALYVLGSRADAPDAPHIEPIGAGERLVALLRHVYVGYLKDRAMRRADFECLAGLAASVPVRRLVPHADPARVWTLCERLRADLAAHTHPGEEGGCTRFPTTAA